MTIQLLRLPADPAARFPPVEQALHEPNGLLAWGGDLHPTRLMNAYRNGIFPWFSEGQPLLWWSPDPRAVFDTAQFRLPRRMRAQLRRDSWSIRADTCFDAVVAACANAPRSGQDGTWITTQMQRAYLDLHHIGHAHSIEVFAGELLVGGIYGVAAGPVFCGESMFSATSGGSKVALGALCRALAGWGVDLLDAQMPTPHLESLGARHLARRQFLSHLSAATPAALPEGSWTERFPVSNAAELA